MEQEQPAMEPPSQLQETGSAVEQTQPTDKLAEEQRVLESAVPDHTVSQHQQDSSQKTSPKEGTIPAAQPAIEKEESAEAERPHAGEKKPEDSHLAVLDIKKANITPLLEKEEIGELTGIKKADVTRSLEIEENGELPVQLLAEEGKPEESHLATKEVGVKASLKKEESSQPACADKEEQGLEASPRHAGKEPLASKETRPSMDGNIMVEEKIYEDVNVLDAEKAGVPTTEEIRSTLESAMQEPGFPAGEARGALKASSALLSSPTSPQLRRAEIDTAAPFESVRAAVSLFGERMEWKPHLRTSSMERRAVVESDLTRFQEELAYRKEQLALTQTSVAGILFELGKTKQSIESLKGSSGSSDALGDPPSVLSTQQLEDKAVTIELQNLMVEIRSTKEQLLSTAQLKQVAVEDLDQAATVLENVSNKVKELQDEQVSVNVALAAAQVALDEAEEQIAELKLNHSAEFQEKVMKDILDGKSQELKDLEEKLTEARGMVQKLNGEIVAVTEAENKAVVAEGEAHNTMMNLKSKLEQAKSAELEAVTALSRVLEELDDVKGKRTKAAEDEASVSSAIQAVKLEVEKLQIELESMHSKEQTACAMMASLQDEMCKVREALSAAHSGESMAKLAKETLPASIKQAAAEADKAKAAAEVSREEIRRARHDAEQAKAATSTASSMLQAALKECEAARASESMALAEIKALTESETKMGDAESEHEGVAGISISLQEYSSLKGAAHEAEDIANKKVTEALVQVEAAKASLHEAQEKLNATNKEGELAREEMQKAQTKADDAQAAKLAAEGQLRKWRAEHEQRRKAGHAPPTKQAVVPSPQAKLGSREDSVKTITKDRGQPEKTVVGLDSLAQVLSLNVPTPDRFGKVLPVEDVLKEKEKAKKKTFMTRVASFLVRKKSSSQVLTK